MFRGFISAEATPPPLYMESDMPGTFWTTVDTTLRLGTRELTGINIIDPNKMLVHMMRRPAISNLSHLSIFSLRDLNLPHYSGPPEIFKQAEHLLLKQPNPVSALIVLAHQRNIFRSTVIDGKPVSSVLLGTGPVLGPDGHRYVIEFGEVDGQRYLSMRRADNAEHFRGNEYWVFKTSLAS